MQLVRVSDLITAVTREIPGTISYSDAAAVHVSVGSIKVEFVRSNEPSLTTVNIADRLKELLRPTILPGQSVTVLGYVYNAGREILVFTGDKGGVNHYQGVYHPGGTCDGHRACIYCGRVVDPS